MSQETREKIKRLLKRLIISLALAYAASTQTDQIDWRLIGDITNSFSNQIVKGIEDIAHQNGYQVMIGSSNYNQESEDKYIESMLLLEWMVSLFSRLQTLENILALLRKKEANGLLIVNCMNIGQVGSKRIITMQSMM